ncbi:MAG: hypothetical protein FJX74_25630, partial [Armatimonadetes bacterium]|nr:hypothetical protein [Armatimonadota bacterium]
MFELSENLPPAELRPVLPALAALAKYRQNEWAAAGGGRALRRANTQADDHQADPAFGLYDFNRKENGPSLGIAKADVPQDGKYHWYRIGRWRIVPGVSLWGHWSWTVGCPDLAKKAYVPDETPG